MVFLSGYGFRSSVAPRPKSGRDRRQARKCMTTSKQGCCACMCVWRCRQERDPKYWVSSYKLWSRLTARYRSPVSPGPCCECSVGFQRGQPCGGCVLQDIGAADGLPQSLHLFVFVQLFFPHSFMLQ